MREKKSKTSDLCSGISLGRQIHWPGLSNHHVFFIQMDLLGPQTQTATLSLLFWGASGSIPRPCQNLEVFHSRSLSLFPSGASRDYSRQAPLGNSHCQKEAEGTAGEEEAVSFYFCLTTYFSPLLLYLNISSGAEPRVCLEKLMGLLNKGFLPKEALTGRRKLGLCSSREL